jgi:hypothetical protein
MEKSDEDRTSSYRQSDVVRFILSDLTESYNYLIIRFDMCLTIRFLEKSENPNLIRSCKIIMSDFFYVNSSYNDSFMYLINI